MYGGRPLGKFLPRILSTLFFTNGTFGVDVRFNDRWHTFTPSAAKGGQVAPIVADVV